MKSKKLASVSFFHEPSQIGGAHVPALAFKGWCDKLGVDCDLIEYNSGSLEGYDGIFFATPPDWTVVKFLISPFVVMIHAEFDAYDPRVMDKADAVIVIGEDFWDFPKQIHWHPCTNPEHLLTGYEVFSQNKKGLLYAARLTTWKSANVLCALSTQSDFLADFGPIDIYGKANDPQFDYAIRCIDSNVKFHDGIYVRADLMIEYIQKDTYWDVFGKKGYDIHMKRLNLSCYEAMKHGCIPIVNMDNVPSMVKSFCIDHRFLSSYYDLEFMRRNMLEAAKTEFFGYEQVKVQVKKILEVLL